LNTVISEIMMIARARKTRNEKTDTVTDWFQESVSRWPDFKVRIPDKWLLLKRRACISEKYDLQRNTHESLERRLPLSQTSWNYECNQ
jgi:hypothetical protein